MRATTIVWVLVIWTGIACAGDTAEPSLSAAEQAIVAKQISTLRSPAERQMAPGWSSAKKVAEFICRPAALATLKKQAKGVDRVFLGSDVRESLTLESNKRLTGTGQFRSGQSWTDFTFTCDLNPDTGKVTAFQPKLVQQRVREQGRPRPPFRLHRQEPCCTR
jgi:hypothetical protein